jgi:hypothetical protein
MSKTFSGLRVSGALWGLGLLAGCSGPTDFTVDDSVPVAGPAPVSMPSSSPELFGGKVTRASGKVAPVAAGTLLVTKDGRAVAADPDRDSVHVVELSSLTVKSIVLSEGDEPGRVVEGPAGTAYVAARRGGAVLAIDLSAGSARRIPVCSAPRGLAFDAALGKLYVACRSGVLAVVDSRTEAIVERFRLDSDLRDVVLSGNDLAITRFKSAEVMIVSRAGEVLRRAQPKVSGQTGASVTPSVAYRTLALPGGGVLVGHVDSSNVTLPSGAGAYYGSICGGSVADMSVSLLKDTMVGGRATLGTAATNVLGGAAGPIDFALSPNGERIAVIASGNAWAPTSTQPPNLWLSPAALTGTIQSFASTCGVPTGSDMPTNGTGPTTARLSGEPVAVAFDGESKWVVQSREPAQLQLEGGAVVALASDRRFDTGMAMFHMNTGGGISCTSCHPEAGEDGHTWNFSVGPRRSQSLEGGASTRAPFHWVGDLTTFDALIDEVMLKRMSLSKNVNAEQRNALRDWLDTVPRAATADDLDAEAVERGRALFDSPAVGCVSCHGGADFTDNAAHDVGTGGVFVTPSLIGVNMRAPLFHDGCAASLTARFGPCGGGDLHGTTSQLTKADEADLVAYMQSL